MTDSYVQLPADGSGKKLEAKELSDGTNTVYRETMVIGDPLTYGRTWSINGSGEGLVSAAVTSSALPTGAATSAKQDTAQTALDAIKTAVETLDNTVAGTELQVDIVTLPAVDTELPAAAALADGSANPTTVCVGALAFVWNNTTWDRAKGVAQVTDSPGTGVQAVGMVARFDDVAPAAITENQYGWVRMNDNRAVHVNLRSGTAEIGTAGAPIRVDPTGTTTQPVSAASLPLPTGAATSAKQDDQTTALQLIDNSIYTEADTDATITGIPILWEDAADTLRAVSAAKPLPVDGSGVTQPVSAATLPLPSGAATSAKQDTAQTALDAIKTAVEIIDNVVSGSEAQVDIVTMPNVTLAAGTNTNEVVGDIAHDTGVGGNPVQTAGAAQDMDDTAPPNRVSAESDVTRFATDRDGTQFFHPHGPQIWSYHEDSSSALTDAEVHASAGAGLSLYVTDIIVSTGAATAFNIFFEESATKKLGPYYLEAVAGRGLSIHFQTPKKMTAATALTVTTSAAIAHSIDVTGFVAPG